MLQVGNKDVNKVISKGKEIKRVQIGDKEVWKKPYIIHIIGSFAKDTPEDERFVWINGNKYTLEEEFDFTLSLDAPWTYGNPIGNRIGTLFGNKLKTLTYTKGFDVNTSNCYELFSGFSELEDISGLNSWNNKITDLSYAFKEEQPLNA